MNMKKYLLLPALLIICIFSGCSEKDLSNKKITEESNKENSKSIEWILPEELSPQGLFPKYENNNQEEEKYYFEDETKYYKVGLITSGEYKNAEILLVISHPYLPIRFASIFRFVKKDNQFILLNEYSDEISSNEFLAKNITLNAPQNIINLLKDDFDLPKEIVVNNAKLIIDKQTPVFFSSKNLIPVNIENKDFSFLNGKLYMEKNEENLWSEDDNRLFQSNGFFLKLPDNTIAIYYLDIPFIEEETYISKIKWENGTENDSVYTIAEGSSCGYRKGTFANVVHNKITMSSYVKEDAIASGFPDAYKSIIDIPFSDDDLKIIGNTINENQPIYSLKDKSHSILKSFYEKNYSIRFKNVNDGTIIPYDKYISKIPFFFWKDPFGRKLVFINTELYFPPVCGAKPVIYLYSAKKQEIEVKINTSKKSFTSYPEYNNGWRVISDSKSNIFDLNSKLNVPYLFWEDLLIYNPPKQGFVETKENISNFLDEKLTFIGLNRKEINDFKDFWLPKMQEKPYYFITFLQTKRMNTLAPLEITPEPDNIIRIFMHFEGLDDKIEVAPLVLENMVKRDGFTVIEWGGRLR